jgi:hypothetical protein
MSQLDLLTAMAQEAIIKFQRAWVEAHVAKLTKEQQEFYHRLYPDGPRNSQLLNAADQIERTIKKNGLKN